MSFKLKTVLGIAAIEFLMLAILVFSGLFYIRSSNEDRLVEQAHVTANLLATMTADATVALDLATLDELVEQAAHNSGIIYTRILGSDGRLLSSAGDSNALAAGFSEDNSINDAEVDGRLDVSAPIEIGGFAFGRVEVGMSTETLTGTIREARDWMLSIAAAEIALVAVFGLLLGHLLTVQLNELRDAARRVADGEFGFVAKVRGRDELSETTNSFNSMSRDLARYHTAMEEALERAEDSRAKAESRLLAAIDAMPHGVAIVEPEGDVFHLNSRYAELYGLPTGFSADNVPFLEVCGLEAANIVALPYKRGDEPCQMSRVSYMLGRIRRFEDAPSFPSWETKLRNGRIILCTQRKMPDGGVVLVDTDVTELHEAADRAQQLERELMQKQKLESLGTLAGGVAHEINTPAQFIGDNLLFVKESVQDLLDCIVTLASASVPGGKRVNPQEVLDETDIEFLREELPLALDQSIVGVSRIRDIVAAVKIYSHPGGANLASSDINQVLQNAVLVTKGQWKQAADVEYKANASLPKVVINEGQLTQVIVNLIVNSIDAITEHEAATMGTAEPGHISLEGRQLDDKAIEITVTDNGPGIPDDVVDRVFDPFFTTKAPGKGTGQGLAISRAIVCDTHGGSMEIHRPESGGTAFTIRLPINGPLSEVAAA